MSVVFDGRPAQGECWDGVTSEKVAKGSDRDDEARIMTVRQPRL